jgi:hypothetical protein
MGEQKSPALVKPVFILPLIIKTDRGDVVSNKYGIGREYRTTILSAKYRLLKGTN